MHIRHLGAGALALIPLVLQGCDDGVLDPDDRRATLSVGFTTQAALGAADGGGEILAQRAADEFTIEGDNGTLTLTDIQLIVSELELEGEDVCEDDDLDEIDDPDGDDECEFESGPFLLDLPLDALQGGAVVVVTEEVPLGTYTELEWEVEDLDLDDDDDEEDQEFVDRLEEIRSDLLGLYPDLPEQATMVIAGTFTPTGGAARSFTVYFDAEIEVETPIAPPLVVDEDGASRELTVVLDPAMWLRDGPNVLDLSALDGQLVEFEAEFEDGVVDVEQDDEEDDE